LKYLAKNDSIVTYKEAEPFTTKVKHIDFSKARRDLNHDPQTPLEEGILRTIEWMKQVYNFK
jgi:dTDP-glucose 4,6-dehydratase